MSDSDDDSLQNNVFTFQNDNTTISARGPNINNTNITGLSFRNNILSSTAYMPGNSEQQRFGGSNYDQKNMYYRRATSTMSLRSVPHYEPPTFYHSTYRNGMSFKTSTYNGRGGSPMSLRSIDSTASVSAADIVFAFKNVKFNKYDLRIIKDAYNKLIKTRQRKRIEKRRNLKLFLNGKRRTSGDDSGEQGSDSSISSDDCRSVRTTICKENIQGLRQMTDISHLRRVTRGDRNCMMRDFSQFNNIMQDNPILTDCTENIKQNTVRNMITNSGASNLHTKENILNTIETKNQNLSTINASNTSVTTQKERFKKGFLLPSQRFNKTIVEDTQINNNDKTKQSVKNKANLTKSKTMKNGTDREQIFNSYPVTQIDLQNDHRKRSLDIEEVYNLNKKRNKVDSPKKPQNHKLTDLTSIPDRNCNDFIFAKPKMPIKKVNPKKDIIPEKLLAKSHVMPIEQELEFNFPKNTYSKISENETVKEIEDCTELDIQHSNSDMSLRPSFIKRKLFTQKLDVAEHKNTSSDTLSMNSPQNIYSASIRERNKARKLVTSQSCLSREIPGEDNNVLDLIHKIVPPEQINIATVANKSEVCNNKSDVDNNNKWDVTAIIANCENQDISDTYTDEEIFDHNHEERTKKAKETALISTEMRQCNIVIEKLKPVTLNKSMKNSYNNDLQTKLGKDINKKTVTDCVKSFWDTDIESDMELNVASSRKNYTIHNQVPVQSSEINCLGDKQNVVNKKASISKGTILTVRNCHKNPMLSSSLKLQKSQINREDKGKEINEAESVVNRKDSLKIGKLNKDTNTTSTTGKKKDTYKKLDPVNNNVEEPRIKLKDKECVDCINTDKPKSTPKKPTNSQKVVKDNDNSYNKHEKNSSNNGNSRTKSHISKDCKNSVPKQGNKDDLNKNTKSTKKNNAKTLKEPQNIAQTQLKRKCRDKSFVQSPKQSKIQIADNSNKARKTKTIKQLVFNDISSNSLSTIMTRSRSKDNISLNTSDSSMNISNISNRSLRLRRRIQRNIN